MTGGSLCPLFEQLSAVATTFGKWVREHEDEIRAWGLWGTVSTACTEARLYAPMHREAWLEIAAAERGDEDGKAPDYEAIITSAYGPGGVGFEALRQELLNAPLLRSRQREVGEVFDSLVDRRNYVTVLWRAAADRVRAEQRDRQVERPAQAPRGAEAPPAR